MSKFYPTWYEAWKDARRQYPEYESPVVREEQKDEKVQTGKRNTKSKKASHSKQDATD